MTPFLQSGTGIRFLSVFLLGPLFCFMLRFFFGSMRSRSYRFFVFPSVLWVQQPFGGGSPLCFFRLGVFVCTSTTSLYLSSTCVHFADAVLQCSVLKVTSYGFRPLIWFHCKRNQTDSSFALYLWEGSWDQGGKFILNRENQPPHCV